MAGYWMGVLLHEIAYERKLRGYEMTTTSEFLGSKDGFNLDADREPVSTNVNARIHPHYFKDVSKLREVDVYRVCQLFGVDDPSGATQHAIKKLLVSGKRGVKDSERDIREAIDTLNRRLQMIAEDCN